MIYTLTLNPAVDYVVYLDALRPGNIQRAIREEAIYGGKGINVSRVLAELDIPSVATGFLAGFTGAAIEAGIASDLLHPDFVRVEQGMTRINVKLRTGLETDINGRGPLIGAADIESLFEKLDQLQQGDILVLAGSIPGTLPSHMYETIMGRLADKGVRFVVDAEQDLLLRSLTYKPFFIKPNNDELGAMFHTTVFTHGEALHYAKELQKQGAVNVLVSLGAAGAVLLEESGNHYYMPACRGCTVDTVGAGDAMVAGFLSGYLSTGDYVHALRLGTAAGSATAFTEGLAKRADIDSLMAQM